MKTMQMMSAVAACSTIIAYTEWCDVNIVNNNDAITKCCVVDFKMLCQRMLFVALYFNIPTFALWNASKYK